MKKISGVPLVISMAWRSMLRNKRRTFLSGGALFLVTVFICLIMSVEYGSINDTKKNIVHHETGAVRIRNPRYTENERVTPLGLFVPDTPGVIGIAEGIDGVTHVEPKIRTGVAVYRDGETNAATVIGTDFKTGYFFTDPDNTLIEGSLEPLLRQEQQKPQTEPPQRAPKYAVITPWFAQTFSLHAGDKFTFMTRTANGGTNGCTATVAAVVHLADNDYSGNIFFMDITVLAKTLRMTALLPDSGEEAAMATELMVFTGDWTDDRLSGRVATDLAAALPHLEVIPWTKANGFYSMLEVTDIIYFIYALIFFALAATVIFNSTMMSVMERKKEIGTLLSLGMAPGTVRNLFLLETVFISGIASLAGSLVGALCVTVFHRIGFDLALIGYDTMEGMNISAMLYPSLSFGRYVEFFLTGFGTAVLACVIPSRMALKVQPAEALRSDN